MLTAIIGVAMATPPAIVNGLPATAEDFPETVAIVSSTGSTCTGSLIHPEWVLSAAHCFEEPKAGIEVVWGTEIDTATERIDAAEVIVHPSYVSIEDSPDGRPHDDVALVRLATPKADGFLMSLNEDAIDSDWIGLDVTYSGFGITQSGGSDGGTKRYVDVPIVGFDTETLFTFDGVHSTCQGDSGGPGVLFKGNAYVQVAVTSYGVECGAGDSGSMRVDAYLPWISAQGVDVQTTAAAPPAFACSHEATDTEAVGVVPFELHCAIEYARPDEITDVSWLFGDGGTSDGLAASHTYLEEGQYTVQACVSGRTEGFGWEHCAYRPAYVRACGVPTAEFEIAKPDLQGMPLTFDFLNRTDTSTYGCLADIQWDITDAAGEPVGTLGAGWSPRYTFPEPGEYTVTLHVGGLGGTGSAITTFDTRDVAALGCSTSPSGGGWLLVAVVLLARRRSPGSEDLSAS